MGYVTCAGRKLKAEDVYRAVEMFAELLHESSEFHIRGEEPWTNVGDFIRSEVYFLSVSIIMFLELCFSAVGI